MHRGGGSRRLARSRSVTAIPMLRTGDAMRGHSGERSCASRAVLAKGCGLGLRPRS